MVVYRTLICACRTDIFIILFVCGGQYVSLCGGHICDGIVFDILYVFNTLGMLFGVIVG